MAETAGSVHERRGGRLRGRPLIVSRVVAHIEATKFRSVALLTVGAVVGWAVSLPDLDPVQRAGVGPPLLWAVVVTALGCMGANTITGYIDRKMDGVMERTRRRPLPTGRLYPRESLTVGLAMVILAGVLALLRLNPWSFAWLAFGVVDATLVYNRWSKPRTSWNVILGSPAGGAPVMVGASAVSGLPVQLVPVLAAALIVAWTPVHIWSLAIRHVDDYRKAGVPMLPVVAGVRSAARCVGGAGLALCATAAGLAVAARFSPAAVVVALLLQVPVVAGSLSVMRDPSPEKAGRLFRLSSPYLAALFALVIQQSLAR